MPGNLNPMKAAYSVFCFCAMTSLRYHTQLSSESKISRLLSWFCNSNFKIFKEHLLLEKCSCTSYTHILIKYRLCAHTSSLVRCTTNLYSAHHLTWDFCFSRFRSQAGTHDKLSYTDDSKRRGILLFIKKLPFYCYAVILRSFQSELSWQASQL